MIESLFFFLAEVLAEIFLVALIRFPGASVRWCFSGGKKSFKSLMMEDSYRNAGVTILLVLAVVGLFFWVKYQG